MPNSNKFMDVNGLSYLYNKLLERLGLFEDETTQNIEKFKEETLASINEAVEGIGSILDGKAEAAIDAAAKVDDFMKECTDTFATKSEVNNMISNLSSFEVAVVSALPKKGVRGTIYLMLASDGSGDDIYNEYLWIPDTSKFEKIGTTRIDLTPYAKTADVANGYLAKTATAAAATKLATARTINGTSFDGTGNITTANWGTARNIYIADSDSSNTGAAVSVNGSVDAALKLPANVKFDTVNIASKVTIKYNSSAETLDFVF